MWKTRSKMSATAENLQLFFFLELKNVKFSTLLTEFSTKLFNIDVENIKTHIFSQTALLKLFSKLNQNSLLSS